MRANFTIYDAAKIQLRNRSIEKLDSGREYYAYKVDIVDKAGKAFTIDVFTEDLSHEPFVEVVGIIEDRR